MLNQHSLRFWLGRFGPRLARWFYPEIESWRLDTNDKTIYLTFDDGPSQHLTAEILDLLAYYSAKATFFVTGRQAEKNHPLMNRMANEGHGIGNHSYAHLDPWTNTLSEVVNDVMKADASVKDATGIKTKLFRPPFGHLTPGLMHWCRNHHRKVILWDVLCWEFASDFDFDSAREQLQKTIRPGSIMVLHDGPFLEHKERTLDLLEWLLHTYSKKGWRFCTL